MRAEVLFNGFEAERFVRAAASVADDTPMVVFLGRHEERKGVATRHRGGPGAQRDAPTSPWRLVVLGDGPQRPRAAKPSPRGRPRSTFVGARERRRASVAWLRGADVARRARRSAARASGWSSSRPWPARPRSSPATSTGTARRPGVSRRWSRPATTLRSRSRRSRRALADDDARVDRRGDGAREEWSMTRLDGPLPGALRAAPASVFRPTSSLGPVATKQTLASRRSRPVARPQPALRGAGPRSQRGSSPYAPTTAEQHANHRVVRDFALAPPLPADDRRRRRGRAR